VLLTTVMDMHPILIGQLADQRRADLLREAAAGRRVGAFRSEPLLARLDAALARVRRPAAVVCCPA
jgi:hypothetical protein